VDDSVARVGNFGPAKFFAARAATSREQSLRCLQRGRFSRLALIAITLVVDGQAFVSQHIGDMDHYEALHAFLETRRLAAISAVAR
jgi:hydrogenase maturation protein HypF